MGFLAASLRKGQGTDRRIRVVGGVHSAVLEAVIDGQDSGALVLVIGEDAGAGDFNAVGVTRADQGSLQHDRLDACATDTVYCWIDVHFIGARLALDDKSVHGNMHRYGVVADSDRPVRESR